MDDVYKIIDSAEIKIPFILELTGKEVTHTIIQGTVGTGMASTYYQIFSNISMKLNGIKDFPFQNHLIKEAAKKTK